MGRRGRGSGAGTGGRRPMDGEEPLPPLPPPPRRAEGKRRGREGFRGGFLCGGWGEVVRWGRRRGVDPFPPPHVSPPPSQRTRRTQSKGSGSTLSPFLTLSTVPMGFPFQGRETVRNPTPVPKGGGIGSPRVHERRDSILPPIGTLLLSPLPSLPQTRTRGRIFSRGREGKDPKARVDARSKPRNPPHHTWRHVPVGTIVGDGREAQVDPRHVPARGMGTEGSREGPRKGRAIARGWFMTPPPPDTHTCPRTQDRNRIRRKQT